MPFIQALPEAMLAAASSLQGLGTQFTAANSAAAGATTSIVPAAADEVSAMTAAHFATNAQMYQAAGAQAVAIHQQFASALGTSANSYAETEVANASMAQ